MKNKKAELNLFDIIMILLIAMLFTLVIYLIFYNYLNEKNYCTYEKNGMYKEGSCILKENGKYVRYDIEIINGRYILVMDKVKVDGYP